MATLEYITWFFMIGHMIGHMIHHMIGHMTFQMSHLSQFDPVWNIQLEFET